MRRGDIYYADLGQAYGSEQGGLRPIQYINMGWILVRGYEINGITKFLLMKDDVNKNNKDSKNCSGMIK